LRKFSN